MTYYKLSQIFMEVNRNVLFLCMPCNDSTCILLIILLIVSSLIVIVLAIVSVKRKKSYDELLEVLDEKEQKIKELEIDKSDLSTKVLTLNENATSLRRDILDKQLQLDKFTVNRHSFRNSLNVIQSFANRTNDAIECLTQVLDYMLYESNPKNVPLEEEINFIDSFIEMNKLKLSPTFDIKLDKGILDNSEWVKDKMIAPLISVGFVENAFKHGILEPGRGFIHIKFEILSDNSLIYSVRNKIDPERKSSATGGLGLENLERRLNMIYEDKHELSYDIRDDVYSAFLKLDLNG